MSAPVIDDDTTAQLAAIAARMLEVKERRDALDAEYAQLRNLTIELSGTGRRVLPSGLPVSVSARRTFDPNLAEKVLNPNILATILARPRIDPKLARTILSDTDYERCLSDVVTYNVRLG